MVAVSVSAEDTRDLACRRAVGPLSPGEMPVSVRLPQHNGPMGRARDGEPVSRLAAGSAGGRRGRAHRQRRQRRLLTALALNAGGGVGCDALAELVWEPGCPPIPTVRCRPTYSACAGCCRRRW